MGSLGEQQAHNHVLMVTLSAQGHLNPMIRLANLLASKGLEITLATNEYARESLLNSTSTIATTSTDGTSHASANKIHLDFFSDGLSIDFDRKSNFGDFIESVSKFAPLNLSKLIENSSTKFSCIITNSFAPWVADVALQHDIPCALLWIQPCALYAIYYRYFNEINEFPIENDMEIELPGFPILKTQDLPSFLLPSNPLESITKLLSQLFQNINKMKWVLVNSFYELEKEVVESMSELSPMTTIGPLVPKTLLGVEPSRSNLQTMDMWIPEESCLEWLDQKPPSSVIYISFGSLIELSENQMKNLALGLKKSNHSFLWVVKPSDQITGIGGKGQLPSGFLEEVGDRGLAVSWCPQTKVLNHKAIACFITHCGWNSTVEALCTGVPVIGIPQWTDQPTNAKLITDVFKMGLRMETDENRDFTVEEVLKCINEVMGGEKMEQLNKNAKEWKEEARDAVRNGGSSIRNIENFINEITKGEVTFLDS